MPPPSPAAATSNAPAPPLPDYLVDTYHWAYLNRRLLPWLDRQAVVNAILWGNADQLIRAACAEFEPGQRILQAACVYGVFSPVLARRLGPGGRLEVVDVSRLQVANARRKLRGLPQARVRRADLVRPLGTTHDGVLAFFLLHEVPPGQRRAIVDNLLAAVEPGGKAVFVDYHRPARWHPLGPLMHLVFRLFEPYAPSLLDQAIHELSPRAEAFTWSRRTCFGGLYQVVVARHRGTKANQDGGERSNGHSPESTNAPSVHPAAAPAARLPACVR
ncbi:class I SAM-dependent methyltransferase [Pseudothauera nasutitermitis]|uniref:Class I SAM-dependent methyltransferase n=1 Tax=Pseudothauera nasutitermitis TaxID=2565930 RepID=A0A4S4B1G7_9RHOO|nr:rhodoquinone biosynthesis methyltransferase RquA [Pseudothauera nasutitermitis]THF66299.1 class I SAM-dependent methyltransferase [Pseudothauera nasutitermitis]